MFEAIFRFRQLIEHPQAISPVPGDGGLSVRCPARLKHGRADPTASRGETELAKLMDSYLELGESRIHYLHGGMGPAVVLLHGWPQTGHCWRHIAAELAESHTVLVPDLRGYGGSGKPSTGYDKRTMANDIRELLYSCGQTTASVVGHDRGARVAHRWGLDHPEDIERLVLLDITPSRYVWQRMDAGMAVGLWHWAFHAQPDLPERLVGQNIRLYLEHFFRTWAATPDGIDPAAVTAYVKAFSAAGALSAGFEDYRASYGVDRQHDDVDAESGHRLPMPVLVLWGAAGLVGTLPVLKIWKEYAVDVRGEAIPSCGHFVPEEAPTTLLRHLKGFLPPS